MAVKSKAKTKSTSKAANAKAAAKKTKAARKAAPAAKPKAATKIVKKAAPKAKPPANKAAQQKPAAKPALAAPVEKNAKPRLSTAPVAARTINPLERRRMVSPALRPAQYSYMKAPGSEHTFEVGDIVEVFCDHEKGRERVRGWLKGIVVQVDYKMVAVQFRSNVFLTDGWMVPDRILWYPLNSEHIRALPGKKSAPKKELIPDY